MSWQALSWATRAGKDYELSPTTRLILWAMANYADPEGNDIYPSISTLCDDTGLGESTVKRAIKHLCTVGILTMGDQRAVDRIPKNKRPTVYRFIFQGRKGGQAGPSTMNPLDQLGGSFGSLGGSNRGATVNPKPVKTKEEPSEAPPSNSTNVCWSCGGSNDATSGSYCLKCSNSGRNTPMINCKADDCGLVKRRHFPGQNYFYCAQHKHLQGGTS